MKTTKNFTKKTTKKLLTVALLSLAVLGLGACGNGDTADEQGSGAAKDTVTVGVIQYATHASLDNCYTGFVEGLAEGGYVEGENLTIDFQNADGQTATGDLQAKNMVTSKYDLICGIATPAAMSAYSAAKDSDIPIIFSAVSDPLAAGLIKSYDKPDTNCTGTSDSLNLEGQLKMIRAFLPEADTIGILYTTGEPNSVSHLERIQELAPDYGFTIEAIGVTNSSEVGTACAALIAKGVDCLNNFTDNNVVDNLTTVLHATNAAGIPVFGSEIEQVKKGCLASESLDYVELGRATGRMAAQILSGAADASTLATQIVVDSQPVYNKTVAEALGITVPADYAAAEAVE